MPGPTVAMQYQGAPLFAGLTENTLRIYHEDEFAKNGPLSAAA